jgi:multidrug resistance efflux pump
LQQKRATLAEAEQTVKQLLAAAEAAQAKVNEEIASRDRAKKSFARYQAGNHLPGGAVARVAVYTDHWHEFALLRKILLRMKSWENYIFLEGR